MNTLFSSSSSAGNSAALGRGRLVLSVLRLFPVFLCLVCFASRTLAAYTISLRNNGFSAATVAPGSTFDLDVSLISDALDRHNSAILRLSFSAPGLIYQAYKWAEPYQDSTSDDDSKPLKSSLPVRLSSDTLSGSGYPTGVVDVELSNVIDQGPPFGTGRLLTLAFQVPADYSGAGNIIISAVPDTFADGFIPVPALAGSGFTLSIGPAATGYAVWKGKFFSVGEEALAMPSADPDQDGLPNAAEYAFARIPAHCARPPSLHFPR